LTEQIHWQTRMMARITSLGLGGFAFGPGVNWWPLDEHGRKSAGPFKSTDEFDAWLTEQETLTGHE
jgi:hypothetical protein